MGVAAIGPVLQMGGFMPRKHFTSPILVEVASLMTLTQVPPAVSTAGADAEDLGGGVGGA
jgi:hypothetical protein